jgi:hypothetical protein
MRRATLLLLQALALAACGETRARPEPFTPTLPGDSTDLVAEVMSPRTSDIVRGGDTVRVLIHAAANDNRLIGLGFVARRFNGATLDSGTVRFSGRTDSTHEFVFRLSPTLPSNTQVDVIGIAFGANDNTVVSATQSVIVIACTPGTASCR